MQAEIPFEIFEEVIKEAALLSDQSTETLKALALTSKDFRNPCQKQLFHSVNIPPFGKTEQLEALHSILSASPRISHYIRRLRVVFDRSVDSESLPINPILADLLSQMQQVTHLRLNLFRPVKSNKIRSFTWSHLPTSLHQSLMNMLSSPNLVHLYIQGVHRMTNEVTQIIVSIPTVSLGDTISFESYATPSFRHTKNEEHKERRLHNLTVSRMNRERISPLMNAIRDRHINLEALSLYSYDEDFLSYFLNHHGNHLTKLSFHRDLTLLKINNLPCLRIIKLKNISDRTPEKLNRVISFLESISTSCEPEVLEFEMLFSSLESLRGACFQSEAWKTLDELLSGTNFNQLHAVRIYARERGRITKWENRRVMHDYLCDVLPLVLPIMHEKGLLQIGQSLN